ncbi:hypothetical protein Acr_20g0010340 [Actinidia rufa]|uniref:Uncharacterized protein n=1 Tax=Actinidia rufa TaxID=165716 RepID=A0A7J0GEI8_9ERIC|nr:hypothetical protein Acr_20g0010340 [Actinidia rufa]
MTAFGLSQDIMEVYPTSSTIGSKSVPMLARRPFELPTTGKSPRTPQREAFSPEGSKRKEGSIESSSSHDSPNPIDDEKGEEKVVGQLALNRRRGRSRPPEAVLPVVQAPPPTGCPSVEVAMVSLQRAMAISDRMAEYSTELKQAKKKMETEASKAKLVMADVNQLKADLVLAEQARDASYAVAAEACGPVYERVFTQGVNRARENYNRQVVEVRSKSELQAAICGPLSCLNELDVPEDNSVWAKAVPAPNFLESFRTFFPLILPGFNKEEFLNRPDEDEGALKPVPGPCHSFEHRSYQSYGGSQKKGC